MSGFISKLQVNNEAAQLIGSNLYGICDSQAADPAKIVILPEFDTLANSGVTVHVKFTNGNTAPLNSSLTLAVGSTAATPISNPGGSVSWADGSVISFTYDGIADKWQVNDGNVTAITILNTYSATSEEGISGKGVAAALGTLGAASHKGVDTSIPQTPTDDNVPSTAAIVGYVNTQVSQLLGSADAMIFKGTLGQNNGDTISAVPTGGYSAGWTYRITTAGTYADEPCEVGDLLIAIADAVNNQSTVNASHWVVAQGNIDGAVIGPASSTDAHVVVFNGTTGKIIKDSGFTIAKSVPSNAVFTDTTYTATASTTINYLNDANYLKGASVNLGVLHITTVSNAPTITPVTAITPNS